MNHPIVLGYDGSECSAAALDEAIELALDEVHGEIVLVYCHEPPPGLACALDSTCDAARVLRDYEQEIEEDVRPVLDAAEERIRAAGLHGEVLMVWDAPASALPRIALSRHAHVIVVGSHGEGALGAALRHSTCYELLHRSDVPVLVVPHRRHAALSRH
jgi:nucleotide-binding universal stress UspA family protein